jgi:type IV pilus assembly protein PilY1
MNTPEDFTLQSDLAELINGGSGWYVTFNTEGEKVITQAMTFSGSIFFNTFSPTSDLDANDTASCGADTGQSRFYAVDLKFPLPSLDLEDGASQILANSGIAPRPVVIYREGGGKSIAIGTETIEDERFNEDTADSCPAGDVCEASKCEAGNCYVTPVYWRQNDNN